MELLEIGYLITLVCLSLTIIFLILAAIEAIKLDRNIKKLDKLKDQVRRYKNYED